MKKEKNKNAEWKRKRKILKFLEENETIINSYIVAIVLCILMMVFKFLNIQDYEKIASWVSIILLLLDGLILTILKVCCRNISSKYEDSIKLETNYSEIVKLYNKSHGFIMQDTDFMPVILDAWLYDKRVLIGKDSTKNYKLPSVVEGQYNKILAAHKKSEKYNSITVRVLDWSVKDDDFEIITERTTYYDHLVTNRAMDYEFEDEMTVRKLYECGPLVHDLRTSLLANQLGVNGFIETKDGKLIVVRRKDILSIGKNLWSGSVSGCIKGKYALDKNHQFSTEKLYESVIHEIEDELAIDVNSLEGNSPQEKILFVSAYRDLVEGGKPHLLFYAKCNWDYSRLKENLNERNDNNMRKIKECHSEVEKRELTCSIDVSELDNMRVEDLLHKSTITSDTINVNGTEYKTIPSYAACFVMIREYLKTSLSAYQNT